MSRPWATLPIQVSAQIGESDSLRLGTVTLSVPQPASWDDVFELNLADVLRTLQDAIAEYQE